MVSPRARKRLRATCRCHQATAWPHGLPAFSCMAPTFRSRPGVAGCRAERVGAVLPPFLQNFPAIWDERRNEIVKGLHYLETYDLAGKTPAEIWQYMVDARAFHVRAWEIHFDLMYPLTANYLGFYGLCKELGIAAPDIPKFLQGYETQPMKSDRAMWQLANSDTSPETHRRHRAWRYLQGAEVTPAPCRIRARNSSVMPKISITTGSAIVSGGVPSTIGISSMRLSQWLK